MNNSEFCILNRKIGMEYPPYIIAEMSANHNGDIKNAFSIIDKAKQCGADAVKIQTYTADTLTLKSDNPDFIIEDGLWAGQTLYQLYESAYTPWEWHKDLFEYAKSKDITMFSSPFDSTAIDLLEDLNAPAYKIASFEVVDLALIRYAASTGKPLIMSTGMADFEEISEAITAAQEAGCKNLAILHCVSGYPAPEADYNLFTIPDMVNKFKLPIGLSDHTLTNTTAIASVALGASIIEKHFTLDRSRGGPDDSFSLEPSDLIDLCESTKSVWSTLGQIDYGRKSSELGNVKFRRSLYYVKNIKKGEEISHDNIKSVRPGYGLAPKHLDEVIGKKVKIDVRKNTPVNWDSIE